MQLIVSLGFSFGKMQKYEKNSVFRGCYGRTGSYGWIGVYRVNCTCNLSLRPSI